MYQKKTFFYVRCTIFSKKRQSKKLKLKKENYKENIFSQISPQINSFSIVGLCNIRKGKPYWWRVWIILHFNIVGILFQINIRIHHKSTSKCMCIIIHVQLHIHLFRTSCKYLSLLVRYYRLHSTNALLLN